MMRHRTRDSTERLAVRRPLNNHAPYGSITAGKKRPNADIAALWIHGLTTIANHRSTRILVIDENDDRGEVLARGLAEGGFADVTRARRTGDILEVVAAADPDVILIDLENPQRDVVDQMFRMTAQVKRPVALFVDQSDRETTLAAIRAGVSAYVVDGLREERIRPIVELAISRFEVFRDLETRAVAAEEKLETRKVVDRAKSILMRRRSLTEEQAYRLLQTKARSANRRLVDVAASVIEAETLGL